MTGEREQRTRSLADRVEDPDRAPDALDSEIYEALRDRARHYFEGERAQHTLQPTALVHEAWIRLIEVDQIDWKGRSHFFAMASRMMRRVLVDHARKKQTKKRGERQRHVTLDDGLGVGGDPAVGILDLDMLLDRLEERRPRRAAIAQLKLFAGLQRKEIAYLLGVSEDTVKDDWLTARAWLRQELSRTG